MVRGAVGKGGGECFLFRPHLRNRDRKPILTVQPKVASGRTDWAASVVAYEQVKHKKNKHDL
jgi:hypothetical protein